MIPDYTFLAEDLASRGYLVASVNRTREATAVESSGRSGHFPPVLSLVQNRAPANPPQSGKSVRRNMRPVLRPQPESPPGWS